MKRLVNIKNPSIVITAPDELINEVWGNCYQVGESLPLTYAKNLWRLEETDVLQGLDEAAEEYAYHGTSDIMKPIVKPLADEITKIFKAGAEWMAGQFVIDGELADGTPVYLKK